MLPNHLSKWAINLICDLVLLNALCALALLLRELLRPPRRIRAGVIALTLLLIVLVTAQSATGYYFAVTAADVAAHVGSVFLYLAAMLLVLTGRRMAWRLNRVVGSLGFAIPVALFALSPDTLIAGAIVLFGLSNPTPMFQGRIAPGSSYSITVDQTLIGNGSYYSYTIYHSPRWLPVVRKKVIAGPVNICNPPAFAVGVNPGANDSTWEVWCRQTPDAMALAEVSTANDIATPIATPQK
jgi:hypothetical protein